MIDQCLPYPGLLERDWILWVELWLRAVRHPEMRPTAARLYARMRDWFAEAIATGIERGELRAGADPGPGCRPHPRPRGRLRSARAVRDLDVADARREVWAAIARDLGLPNEAPAPLDTDGPRP